MPPATACSFCKTAMAECPGDALVTSLVVPDVAICVTCIARAMDAVDGDAAERWILAESFDAPDGEIFLRLRKAGPEDAKAYVTQRRYWVPQTRSSHSN